VPYAIVPVLVAAVLAWLGLRLLSLVIILGYLAVEGFLKLLSNYHPLVHVGLDVVVLAFAGTLVLGAVIRRGAGLPRLPWTWLILLYVLWIGLQVFNPHSAGLLVSLASFKIHLTMIPLYFITAALLPSVHEVRRFLAALVLIALVPFVMALGQYALGPQSVLDLSPRFWQNISYFHEWRPFGTSAVPGGASVFAYLAAPIALVLLVSPGEGTRHRALAVLGIAGAAGAFIVSGVRQTFLGCVLAILTMVALGLTRGRGRGLAALGVVVVLGFGSYVAVETFLQPMATENIERDPRAPDIWRERDVTERLLTLGSAETYLTARANPINGIVRRIRSYPFGAGLGRTGSAYSALQSRLTADPTSARISRDVAFSDNFFSDMVVEAGVPGMVMLTTLLLGMLVGAVKLALRAREPAVATTAAALAGFYASVVMMSWGSQPLLSNPITAYFWVFSGLLAALRRIETEGAATSPEETGLAAAPAVARSR
jgi:hypothetical protein